ncbi:ABC transporter ATP-binding protein [Clostridium beijerinckii]|uniref:ABC transporter ATP-binding protein n=1 Tax=Clostridium beijerinckii TaxID=1520 RepID=A0AAW3WET7_CLOBE|nr:ABC transporter ATP-binding protein [Clostridium beijerinckii]MBC2459834.1 ABC transporter ATP-binding protein [Clostridium beijerinckii]MBC2477337.1 ABC transporter ATP-binding protein [Clostridium beijerinckii]NOV60006.1 putative ABC transport system ATP-binding protein [Clostridium beijerinckii]NOV71212.1 putative ABC transport system ATP-binding protein [Clostridium beijerinckii]NOW34136.1 putative ABC transport system ATP-binding protein [Clostridium beijerinckii]
MSNNIIEMNKITKSFFIGKENQLDILKDIDINVQKGEFIAIVGSSGSGKSTLMNIIGVLDRQTSGQYVLHEIDVSKVSDNKLAEIRNKKIGFVFQTSNLIARTNSIQNVELPMLYYGMDRRTRINRAKELLELVGMGDRLTHLPSELSGGQKQRVAIARALANDPDIILADEPTGALDSETGRIVMNLFHKIHEKQGKTIVLITHDNNLASEPQRILTIKDGKIIGEKHLC